MGFQGVRGLAYMIQLQDWKKGFGFGNGGSD